MQKTLFGLQDSFDGTAVLRSDLKAFCEFGRETQVFDSEHLVPGIETPVPVFLNEFWTSRQRAASRLHEVSYRACFKPQLPRFFIDRLTAPGDVVYDPFMGRGTTVLEAAMLGRIPLGCDINPLSEVLVAPRLAPPKLSAVIERLEGIDFRAADEFEEDLLVFYHPDTLREISALRRYLAVRAASGELDVVDTWIRMVAVNRLTGHSGGFFSVYTLPPNQAVSVEAQRKINEKRSQSPGRRVVPDLIARKSKSLLRDCGETVRAELASVADRARLLTQPAAATPSIASDSVALVVTSPPFLDVVQYAQDNWLRCWFCDIDVGSVEITIDRKLDDWKESMTSVFTELRRVLMPGGFVAFEVGEVRGGKVKLEDAVVPCGIDAGLVPELILINAQEFTKTANCWGIDNNQKGTNTNRVVLFRKC